MQCTSVAKTDKRTNKGGGLAEILVSNIGNSYPTIHRVLCIAVKTLAVMFSIFFSQNVSILIAVKRLSSLDPDSKYLL